jgi:hypothetical protein
VNIAVGLATDRARLAALRSTLRERMKNSVLMDAQRFARQVERAYREMWGEWVVGSPVIPEGGPAGIPAWDAEHLVSFHYRRQHLPGKARSESLPCTFCPRKPSRPVGAGDFSSSTQSVALGYNL